MYKKVLNTSSNRFEICTRQTCPRCKGFGAVHPMDEDGCGLCNGRGVVWRNAQSGLTLPLYGKKPCFY